VTAVDKELENLELAAAMLEDNLKVCCGRGGGEGDVRGRGAVRIQGSGSGGHAATKGDDQYQQCRTHRLTHTGVRPSLVVSN
jgi:hypothetical protein